MRHESVQSNGFNLIGTGNAIGEFIKPGDQTGVADPLLGPLADNGGPTFTHALLAGSPAINAGDLSAVAGVGGVPEFDQRGTPFGRVFNGRIDIGAFEYQAASDLNLVVDTLVDESDGDYSLGDLSLREAILLTNTYPSLDTIQFAPALAGGTILLTLGELTITDNASIIGLGADQLTLRAYDPTPDLKNGDGSRVFNIDDGNANLLDVSITGVTLTGGDVIGGFQFGGGAILSKEDVTVSECTIRGNSVSKVGGGSDADGGGIFNRGNLTVNASTISGNSASRGGGGGISNGQGILAVTGSMISGNTASFGGGIYNTSGSVTVTGSTISDNSATDSQSQGGGIFRLHAWQPDSNRQHDQRQFGESWRRDQGGR